MDKLYQGGCGVRQNAGDGTIITASILVVFIAQIARVPADNHMEAMHINKSHLLDVLGNFTRE